MMTRRLSFGGGRVACYNICEKEKPGSGAKWVGLNTPGYGTRSWVRGYHRITWMGSLTQVEVWAVFWLIFGGFKNLGRLVFMSSGVP